MRLSKDAEKLLCVLYKEYLERRERGKDKIKASDFGGLETIGEISNDFICQQDLLATCNELVEASYISGDYAGNVLICPILTNDAIIYMENRGKDMFDIFLDTLGKVRNLLPF